MSQSGELACVSHWNQHVYSELTSKVYQSSWHTIFSIPMVCKCVWLHQSYISVHVNFFYGYVLKKCIDFCASLILVFSVIGLSLGQAQVLKKGSFISNGKYTVGWKSSKGKYRFCAVWDILGRQKDDAKYSFVGQILWQPFPLVFYHR